MDVKTASSPINCETLPDDNGWLKECRRLGKEGNHIRSLVNNGEAQT